jgi:hypothetical protein
MWFPERVSCFPPGRCWPGQHRCLCPRGHSEAWIPSLAGPQRHRLVPPAEEAALFVFADGPAAALVRVTSGQRAVLRGQKRRRPFHGEGLQAGRTGCSLEAHDSALEIVPLFWEYSPPLLHLWLLSPSPSSS